MNKGEKSAVERAKTYLNNIVAGCISEKDEARKALGALDCALAGGDQEPEEGSEDAKAKAPKGKAKK